MMARLVDPGAVYLQNWKAPARSGPLARVSAPIRQRSPWQRQPRAHQVPALAGTRMTKREASRGLGRGGGRPGPGGSTPAAPPLRRRRGSGPAFVHVRARY